MFRVSYIDNPTDEILQKGDFKSDKEAYNWIDSQSDKITVLKLLIWSEALQCYRTLEKFKSGRTKKKGKR